MKKHQIDVRLLASTNKVTKDEKTGNLTVHLDSGDKLETETCLIAIGRVPNTSGMKLDKVGIYLEKNGAIKVDEF